MDKLHESAGRQWPLVASVTVTYADLVSGVAADLIQLPGGARVIDGAINVVTPFDSVTSDALDFGDSVDPNRLLAAVDLQAAGQTKLSPDGSTTTAPTKLQGTWTGVGTAPTAGEFILDVLYVMNGRANEVVPARP